MTHVVILKRFLIAFWALWLTCVVLSNMADGAKELGLLGESWAFASGNFQNIQATTARYHASNLVNALLFAFAILWECVAAVLLWRAAWTYRGKQTGRDSVYQAFIALLSLWGGFLLADEICIAYAMESVHLRLFTANLVTLLAVELLPEEIQVQDAGHAARIIES